MHTDTLVYYNNERGFGFLGHKPSGHFVHVQAFERAGLEPIKGERYRFGLSIGVDGRTRAVDVSLADEFEDV